MQLMTSGGEYDRPFCPDIYMLKTNLKKLFITQQTTMNYQKITIQHQKAVNKAKAIKLVDFLINDLEDDLRTAKTEKNDSLYLQTLKSLTKMAETKKEILESEEVDVTIAISGTYPKKDFKPGGSFYSPFHDRLYSDLFDSFLGHRPSFFGK